VGTSAAAVSANDKAAFDFFLGKGLSAAQAAGIVGNLDQESGMSPTIAQLGGPGRGIAQWSTGGRWDTSTDDNVVWYAAQQGESAESLTLQLQFIWYELETFPGYGLAALEADTTVDAAAQTFASRFEICGTCDQSNRDSYAQAAYSAYANDQVSSAGSGSTSGSSSSGSGTTCTVATTGESGTCMDTTTCSAAGRSFTPGYCPGAVNIECCVESSGSSSSGTGSATGSSKSSDGCFSTTLGKEAPQNACVQDAANDTWYQCDAGEWVNRWTDPTQCNGIYPL
jgi:hypothetical protein